MKHTIVTTPGGEELVMIAKADFEAMQDAVDAADAARIAAEIASGAREKLTSQEVKTYLAAPTPLAFWRGKRGMTQKALADKIGVSQSYIADLEAGRREGSPLLFKRLAGALRLRMEDLIVEHAG
jgi:DNA-binding XRE family transcriptional regulator